MRFKGRVTTRCTQTRKTREREVPVPTRTGTVNLSILTR